MVNQFKGDVPFEVGGKQFTLCYSHSALVKLEKQLNQGIVRIMRDIDNAEEMRLGTIVALLWAGLQRHHPDMSVDAACDLLDEMQNGQATAVNIIGDAFQKAFAAPGTKGTNPTQKTINGTGMTSSSNTSVSDTSPTPFGTSHPEN